jgi:O-antigen ligase
MPADPRRIPRTFAPRFEGEPIRPLNAVMICLVVGTVAGGMLLLSAARPVGRVDGAIEWHEGSLLHAVVELLCLNHQWPADYASAVKGFTLGMGTGLALLVLAVASVVRPRAGQAYSDEGLSSADTIDSNGAMSLGQRKAHVAPLVAAQMLAVLYLLWSFASFRWSQASDLAIGGSIILLIQVAWALCIGRGFSARAARITLQAIVVVMVVVSILAITYHYGRKPGMRADFPVGNPVFLAACLIPSILLSLALFIASMKSGLEKRGVPARVLPLIALALVLFAELWAFHLTDSRGPMIGLLFGALSMWFFAAHGRTRWGPVVCTLVVVAAGGIYVSRSAGAYSDTGRSASLRLRLYAWDYAWQMFKERPLQGHGQGGFVLTGDSYAVDDVLDDPQAFETRIAHAHNEWLEVMADLGSIGIVLVVGIILFTLRAGAGVLSARPPPEVRWMLIGSMGALVGLVVEEAFGVGLRVPGVDIMFYTVIGLIWALVAPQSAIGVQSGAIQGLGRVAVFGTLSVAGLFVLGVSQGDYASARYVRKAMEAARKGDHEGSIAWAKRAMGGGRLNPQRALTNYFRLCESYLLRADVLQARARDRGMRARQTDPPDPRLLALSAQDFEQSDKACEGASAALKDVVVRSPGFIGQGRLGYWLNLIRAGNAEARNDLKQREALMQDAATSIRRELDRQPFDPGIASDAVRATLPRIEAVQALDILARPLRYHRIAPEYMDLFQHLAGDRLFDAEMQRVVSDAMDRKDADAVEWLPEKLRLAAMIDFIHGDHKRARDILLHAVELYERSQNAVSIGAASCHGELAICQFFFDPTNCRRPLASAESALALLPKSQLGREIRLSILHRMIEFNLACGQEDEAVRLLTQTAPADVNKADVMKELGTRYLRMCETLLGRRGGGGVLREPPAQLTRVMSGWIARSLKLNDTDPSAHYLAADFALFSGAVEEAADHLMSAIRAGLPIEIARDFLRLAMVKTPDNQALQSVYRAITPTDSGGAMPSDGAGEGP